MLFEIVKLVQSVTGFEDVVNVVASVFNESDGCSPREFNETLNLIADRHGFDADEFFDGVNRKLNIKGDV